MELPPAPTPIRRISDERLMRFYFASSGGPPKGGLYFWKNLLCATAVSAVSVSRKPNNNRIERTTSLCQTRNCSESSTESLVTKTSSATRSTPTSNKRSPPLCASSSTLKTP